MLKNEGFTDRDIASMGKGEAAPEMWAAEQLKQLRSDVGQELVPYGKKGVVGAALNRVYGILSDELRRAAKDVDAEKEWLHANDKYSQYSNDFMRGPLRNSLFGSTASAIMEPLTGNSRTQLLDTLQKYRNAGFNIDMDTLTSETRGYSAGKMLNRLSPPGKWDLLLAGLSPKAVALRTGLPRLLRETRGTPSPALLPYVGLDTVLPHVWIRVFRPRSRRPSNFLT